MTEQLNVQQMAERLCAADNILVLCHKTRTATPSAAAAPSATRSRRWARRQLSSAPMLCLPATALLHRCRSGASLSPRPLWLWMLPACSSLAKTTVCRSIPATSISASTTTRATAAMRISPCWTAMRPQRQSFCMRSSARWAWRSPPHRQLPLHRPRYGHRLLPVLFHHCQHPPRGCKAHSGRCAGGGAEHPALRHQTPGADGGGAYRPQPSGISS